MAMMAGSGGESGSKSRMTMSEINVTPLVDVMLVLLVIFMVAAPMMQQGIQVNLPETAASGVEPSDEPFVLVIDKNRKITAGNAVLNLVGLKEKIQAIFEKRHNKQVYLQADKSVDYGTVAETMAEIRAAGIFNIGLITVPRSQGPK